MKGARSRALLALGLVALGAVAGCGRHVVVAPETVHRANGHAWVVTSEPAPAVAASPSPAPAPAPVAVPVQHHPASR